MKDESLSPTGSFKARGLSMAISKVKEFGVAHCVILTVGNAGGAMAAYCASAGIEVILKLCLAIPQKFFRKNASISSGADFGKRINQSMWELWLLKSNKVLSIFLL